MKDQDIHIINAMSTYGGSFVKALAAAARVADSNNYAKLKNTFNDIWVRYEEFAFDNEEA